MGVEQIIVLLVALTTALHLWLDQREARTLRRATDVPSPWNGQITPEQHQRAVAYHLDRIRLHRWQLLLAATLTLLWLAGGLLGQVDALLRSLTSDWRLHALGLFAVVFGFNALAELPLDLYRQFDIEQRHGFNRMSPALFFLDRVKLLMLSVLLGAPLLLALLWIMRHVPNWWLWAGLGLGLVSLLMGWIWPILIAPLFNRFSPLPDGPLKARIEALLAREGFHADGIFIIDGSRRSSHGNAYFTGLGKNKRIVFYDTLLETLDDDEILAVLAHELGHYRFHHVQQGIVVSTLLGTLLFWLADQVMHQPAFSHLGGVTTPDEATRLVSFFLLLPWITSWLEPLLNAWSRRHEFQADRHAAHLTHPEWLRRALLKLYRDNATPLVGDRLHSLFHDTHPPARLRLQELDRLQHGAGT
ncbi:MAG: M48 family peptidase [Gammaproteobacteria bacterium]|nr:MAG: M48 family peptidase [Gammaproteobacteria bacterium]